MNALGKQFFAGPGLSVDQDIGIRITEIDGIQDHGVHDRAVVYDLREMIFGLEAGLMHLLADLSFFRLDLGGILKGQDAPGVVVFSFDGNAVYQKRQIVVILQVGQDFHPAGDHVLHGNRWKNSLIGCRMKDDFTSFSGVWQ